MTDNPQIELDSQIIKQKQTLYLAQLKYTLRKRIKKKKVLPEATLSMKLSENYYLLQFSIGSSFAKLYFK